MQVSIDVEKQGTVGIAVLDDDENEMIGFSCHETVALKSGHNSLVEWRNGASLKGLLGKVTKLKFCVQKAHLYAFQVHA